MQETRGFIRIDQMLVRVKNNVFSKLILTVSLLIFLSLLINQIVIDIHLSITNLLKYEKRLYTRGTLAHIRITRLVNITILYRD